MMFKSFRKHGNTARDSHRSCPGVVLTLSLLLGCIPALAQKHEIGLTLGGLITRDISAGADRVDIGPGTALQVNYGYRIWNTPLASLYGEVHMLASPQRLITSGNQAITRDVASLFIAPGIRVKFLPKLPVAPWAEIGGGYGDFQHSTTLLNGRPNPVARDVSLGVFEFGAGADFPLWRFVGLRAEIRDFVTAPPELNLSVNGKLHNVVAGGGLIIKLGER